MVLKFNMEKKSAVIIIPTTGLDTLCTAIQSAVDQTYKNTTVLVVVDGEQFKESVDEFLKFNNKNESTNLKVVYLPENVGANGFYGHRIYAAFSNLINQDYVFFLDQDNWLELDHVETMISKLESSDFDWIYSLRNICSKDKEFLLKDNCESLGKWEAWTNCYHIDTNCYCLKKEVAVAIASAWYGKWGQDRVVFNTLKHYFPKFKCTGKYTVNYRLDGNPGSVSKEFFEQGNNIMNKIYGGNFPWVN